jgi:polysaccharide export outer membrane protein
MKCIRLFRIVVIVIVVTQLGSAALAQGENHSGADKQTSPSGLTGPGEGGSTLSAAKTGGADGLGNPSLGGGRHSLYRLHPSDVVDLTFTVAPEFNQTLTVQPDGDVMLKDAGAVHALGMSMAEFSAAVEKAYTGYLHDPKAAVALKEFERSFFIVGGEVGRPGKYELRSDITVAEAVQIAGGLTNQSKHSEVVLFRRAGDDSVEARLFDLKNMLKEHNLAEDAHLQPGDMVFVPQNTISKIARFISRPAVGMYMNSSQF